MEGTISWVPAVYCTAVCSSSILQRSPEMEWKYNTFDGHFIRVSPLEASFVSAEEVSGTNALFSRSVRAKSRFCALTYARDGIFVRCYSEFLTAFDPEKRPADDPLIRIKNSKWLTNGSHWNQKT